MANSRLSPYSILFYSLIVFVMMGAVSKHSIAQEMEDPCPDPRMTLDQPAGSSVEMQGDIDRLMLCVERAQLLQRLNDLVTNGSHNPLATPSQQQMPIPAIPQQMLGPLQTQDIREEWGILQIFGSEETLSARLSSPGGEVVRLRTGDKLPDGSGKIIAITPMSVKMRGKNGTKTLAWVEE